MPNSQSDKLVLLERQDSIATITLNDPSKLNALSTRLIAQLSDALDECAQDKHLRALVLTGAGRGFCAGADLSPEEVGESEPNTDEKSSSDRTSGRGEPNLPATGNVIERVFNPLIQKLIDMPLPTLCAVNGVAAGGGFGLALSCDLVIASDKAKFILVFTNQLGLIPDMGSTWLAPRLLGRTRAMAAAFFGEPITAAQAYAQGLVWKCVDAADFEPEVQSAAQRLASGPTDAYPQVRAAFDQAASNTMQEQLALEARVQPELLASENFAEGVRAFQQKRKPRFRGRS